MMSFAAVLAVRNNLSGTATFDEEDGGSSEMLARRLRRGGEEMPNCVMVTVDMGSPYELVGNSTNRAVLGVGHTGPGRQSIPIHRQARTIRGIR